MKKKILTTLALFLITFCVGFAQEAGKTEKSPKSEKQKKIPQQGGSEEKSKKGKEQTTFSLDDVQDMLETSYIRAFHRFYFDEEKKIAVIGLESFGKKPSILLGPVDQMQKFSLSPEQIRLIMLESKAREELLPRVLAVMQNGVITKLQPITNGTSIMEYIRITYESETSTDVVWVQVRYQNEKFKFIIEPKFN